MTRLQADVEQEQQAADETIRTLEAREHAVAEAEAAFEERSAALAELERKAEAAEQRGKDEAERVRQAAADLAARERALTEDRAEQARRSEPPPVPTGFLAGLEALASASHERKSRREKE